MIIERSTSSHDKLIDLQASEDEVVSESLARTQQLLHARGVIADNTGFYLCSDPEEIGIDHASLIEMEAAGYFNSGYEQRAEGKRLFSEASRGYDAEDMGELRFSIVAQKDEDNTRLTPIAFFDYFRANKYFYPESEEAARSFIEGQNYSNQPSRYIFSKLVANPERPSGTATLHRDALFAVANGLASLNPAGIFIEAKAQPATRRMVRSIVRYMTGSTIVLDKDIPSEDGGNPSKLLLHVRHEGLEQAS